MLQPSEKTYLLIGTVTKDLLPDGGYTTGGTVTYAGAMAKRLGWRPVIVTAAAADFAPPAHLADAEWRIASSPATTTFVNEYTPQGRRQTIGPIARSIEVDDIPPQYYQAPIVHICPLAQDVKPAVIDLFDSALLVTTLQGWLRQWDAEGLVSMGDWRQICDLVPEFDAVVLSDEDIQYKESIAEVLAAKAPVLAVTQGQAGCTIFNKATSFPSPPRPATPLDPTGAGDVFAAAFFIRYHETKDLQQAAHFANVAASMAIERPGPAGVPSREEILAYQRSASQRSASQRSAKS
ncbi:MAG TPA: hypothetical protein ENK24_02960 [Anaerolineae bacterium]|nr:hypothetical protein [Anaerolineae bacterium]